MSSPAGSRPRKRRARPPEGADETARAVVQATSHDPVDEPLPALAEDYLAYLCNERRLSATTLANTRRDLRDLAVHQRLLGAKNVALTSQDIRRFLSITHSRGMTPRAIARLLSGWRGYFRFALKQGLGTANPCDGVRAPKAARPLPRTMSPDEAIRLVTPTITEESDAASVRDRAAFEMLYSCGLRISELVGLDLDSIDASAAEVRVTGKGNKTRIVPVGAPALAAVHAWLARREGMLRGESNALFLGQRGERISARVLQLRIKRQALAQGIEVDVHPHMLRHSFASHLLQSSQNLRAVQEMMGHTSIASTQVYTHLDFQHLAKVYDQSHPRAKKAAVKK